MFGINDIEQFTLNYSDGQAYAFFDSLIVLMRTSSMDYVQHLRQLRYCLESVIPSLDSNLLFNHKDPLHSR